MNSVDSSPDPNTQSFTIHYLEKSNKIIDLFLSYFFLFLLSISSTFLKSRVNALSMPFFVIPMELCEKNIQLFNSSFLTPSK